MFQNINIDELQAIIILLGATIGSVKLSLDTHDHHKGKLPTILDIILGVFIGVLIGYSFGTQYNIYISGLISLVGGAVGAMALTAIIELFPTIFRNFVYQYLKLKNLKSTKDENKKELKNKE